MRQYLPESDAAFFSSSSSLNGPIPGSSYASACMQFATGDPAVAGTVVSGAISTRCLVPDQARRQLRCGRMIMASVAVKEAMAHRTQAAELRQGPTPL